MTTLDDFFTGPERDQYGRPLLYRASGEMNPAREDGRWPYTRASSLADYVSDKSGLHVWQMRNTVRGLGRRPDLVAIAGAVADEDTGPRDTAAKRRNARMNAELDEVISQAFESSGASGGRNYGTAFHALTEPGTTGYAPDHMLDDIESLGRVMAERDIRVVDTEQFVANDEAMSAGTFDHIAEVPGYGRVVADKKTGRHAKLQDWAIQLAVYAGGDRYDFETDERHPLDVSQDWGLVMHTPKGTGETYPIMVDLQAGRYGIRLARAVFEYRKATVSRPL